MILGIVVRHDPKVICISHLNLLLKGLGHKLRSDVGPLWYMVEKAMYCQTAGNLVCCHSDSSCFFKLTLRILFSSEMYSHICYVYIWYITFTEIWEKNMLFQHQNFLGFPMIWNAIKEKNLEKNFNEKNDQFS